MIFERIAVSVLALIVLVSTSILTYEKLIKENPLISESKSKVIKFIDPCDAIQDKIPQLRNLIKEKKINNKKIYYTSFNSLKSILNTVFNYNLENEPYSIYLSEDSMIIKSQKESCNVVFSDDGEKIERIRNIYFILNKIPKDLDIDYLKKTSLICKLDDLKNKENKALVVIPINLEIRIKEDSKKFNFPFLYFLDNFQLQPYLKVKEIIFIKNKVISINYNQNIKIGKYIKVFYDYIVPNYYEDLENLKNTNFCYYDGSNFYPTIFFQNDLQNRSILLGIPEKNLYFYKVPNSLIYFWKIKEFKEKENKDELHIILYNVESLKDKKKCIKQIGDLKIYNYMNEKKYCNLINENLEDLTKDKNLFLILSDISNRNILFYYDSKHRKIYTPLFNIKLDTLKKLKNEGKLEIFFLNSYVDIKSLVENEDTSFIFTLEELRYNQEKTIIKLK